MVELGAVGWQGHMQMLATTCSMTQTEYPLIQQRCSISTALIYGQAQNPCTHQLLPTWNTLARWRTVNS
jgi:hypothetical protein